ncbi:MAG: LuxR C-terminal-related transcriptional regulator [Acidaminococcaceae bacterium]|nr:LuxR C-terminal-related transcriptional regulator [Acidaminococcaceae bacterium]MCI2110243.1 LuxR C-terminal-related transcriptional regulator [Acidaminococcaceae bacterium]
MVKCYMGQNWLNIVGKEKLQTFQDAFAQAYNLGMRFEDVQGKSLTVSAKASLLCHKLQEKNKTYCIEEHKKAREETTDCEETRYFTCNIGVSYFICPVFWQKDVVAYARVGCYISRHSSLPERYIKDYNIPVFTAAQIKNIGYLLTKTLELLNVNYQKTYKTAQNATLLNPEPITDDRLSTREQEVVGLLCKGFTNKQIAESMVISEKTVKTHISNILNKMSMRDRMQVVLYFLKGKMAV